MHEIPLDIVPDISKISSPFLASASKTLWNLIKLCISYHPKIDGKTERVNQILKDMLRACVLEFEGKWEDDLQLVQFSYNSSTS